MIKFSVLNSHFSPFLPVNNRHHVVLKFFKMASTTKRLKPNYNAGDFCRIFRESPNGNPKTECKIVSIEGEVRIC